jgi:biotin transport system substrate-specific component
MKQKITETRDFVYAAFFTALIALLGIISIPLPISPVPITGLNLGIMLAGSILTARQAFFSVLTLIVLGGAGVPVFSGMAGGIGVLLGPRGGYYWGFLFGAALIARLRDGNNTFWRLLLANIAGGAALAYAFGVPWLSVVTGISLGKAAAIGALPFIPGDVFKAVVAAMIGVQVNKRRQLIGK